jgi:hypothetical protein
MFNSVTYQNNGSKELAWTSVRFPDGVFLKSGL